MLRAGREVVNRPLTATRYQLKRMEREQEIAGHRISSRWPRILEGITIAAFALISTIAVARVGLEPSDVSRGVGVIFAPWNDEATVIARAVNAGGRLVQFGESSFIVIVQPESADYIRRVKDAGALLVVDTRILAACLRLTSMVRARQ